MLDPHSALAGLRDLRFTPAARLTGLLAGCLAAVAVLTANPWLMLACGALGGLLVWPVLRGVNLRRVSFRVEGPTRVRAGESVRHDIVVRNHHQAASGPLTVTVTTRGFADAIAEVPHIAGLGQVRVPLLRTAATRAASNRSQLHAASEDAFGLTAFRATWVDDIDVLVHPAPARPATLPPALALASDDCESTASGPGTEFAGVRPWRRGDSSRHVHWRATAKHRQLVVVQRATTVGHGVAIAVIGQSITPRDEELLSIACATADALLHAQHPVCLIAGDGQPRVMTPATVTHSRDWFAQLDQVGTPEPADLVAALPPGPWALVVANCASMPPAFMAGLREVLAARRIDLADTYLVAS